MEGCFSACGCDELGGVSQAELDRFTDRIEQALGDERGRRLFRAYMFSCKMRDGRRALDFYEHADRLLQRGEGEESSSYGRFLADVDDLIDEAERIEELDFAIMERLSQARDSRRKEDIVTVLKLLKAEATKALRREYSAFRKHYIPSGSK